MSPRSAAAALSLVAAASTACWEGSKAADVRAAAGASQAGTSQAGGGQAGTSRAGSSQAGSSQAGASQAGSSQAGSSQAGTSQAGSSQAGSSQAGGGQGGGAPVCDDTDTPCPKGSLCGYEACAAPSSLDCPRACLKIVAPCAPGVCAPGEYCRDVDYNDVAIGLCAKQAAPGAACEPGVAGSCVDGAYCKVAGATRACAPIPKPGEPCEVAPGSCGPGKRCEPGGVCVDSVAAGGACADTSACVSGAFCGEAGKCEPLRPVGGACRPVGSSCASGGCKVLSLECQKGLRCAPSGPTGACFAPHDCGVDVGLDCCVGPGNTGACSVSPGCLAPLGACAAP